MCLADEEDLTRPGGTQSNAPLLPALACQSHHCRPPQSWCPVAPAARQGEPGRWPRSPSPPVGTLLATLPPSSPALPEPGRGSGETQHSRAASPEAGCSRKQWSSKPQPQALAHLPPELPSVILQPRHLCRPPTPDAHLSASGNRPEPSELEPCLYPRAQYPDTPRVGRRKVAGAERGGRGGSHVGEPAVVQQ